MEGTYHARLCLYGRNVSRQTVSVWKERITPDCVCMEGTYHARLCLYGRNVSRQTVSVWKERITPDCVCECSGFTSLAR